MGNCYIERCSVTHLLFSSKSPPVQISTGGSSRLTGRHPERPAPARPGSRWSCRPGSGRGRWRSGIRRWSNSCSTSEACCRAQPSFLLWRRLLSSSLSSTSSSSLLRRCCCSCCCRPCLNVVDVDFVVVVSVVVVVVALGAVDVDVVVVDVDVGACLRNKSNHPNDFPNLTPTKSQRFLFNLVFEATPRKKENLSQFFS